MAALTVAGQTLVFEAMTPVTVNHTTGTINGFTYSAYAPASGPVYIPLLCCHQLSGGQEFIDSPSPALALVTRLASLGFPCISIGDGDVWGNNASRTTLDAMRTHCINNLGANASQVALFGMSMGGTTVGSWAGQHASEVSSIVLTAPIMSTQDSYDNRGTSTSINTAYGGAGAWTTAAPTHDPTPIAVGGGLNGIPMRIWYGSTDLNVPPATVTTFAASVTPAPSLVLLTGYDHIVTIGATNYIDLASFVVANYNTTARLRTLMR